MKSKKLLQSLPLILLIFATGPHPAVSAAGSGRGVVNDDARAASKAVEELLAADRAFSAAAANTDLITALSNMFADDVLMPAPGGIRRGREDAVAALKSNPLNAGSRVSWTPARGGVSSDGLHGFTFGYMDITRADKTAAPAKYVAYWVKTAKGWRVAAYKRAPRRAVANFSPAMLPPSLPTPGLKRGDAATVKRYAEELHAAEVKFSDDATPLGLGPAFTKHAAPDAVNGGGPDEAEFVQGPEAIGNLAGGSGGGGGGVERSIKWAPNHTIVASTGDLGVNVGTIASTTKPADGKPAETRETPFITIWKRATPRDPWRFVAE